MMNAMLLVLGDSSRFPRHCDVSLSVYVNLPYSASGARIVRIAWWTAARGLQITTHHPLFLDKFNNFCRATVNVTALPYKPFWSETEDQGGVTRYSGSDVQMLMTIAETLNFTYNVLPVTTWDQVTGLVSQRTSFMAAINHVQMPQRLLLYDYTYSYHHNSFSFTMATPSLISNWQSLYSPLTDKVWASVIASLVLVPVFLFLVRGDLSCHKKKLEIYINSGKLGASLCALRKIVGGIRPIAVGNSLRRLKPKQLGFGVPQGYEASVHTARAYIANITDEKALIKLDFKNAFNLIARPKHGEEYSRGISMGDATEIAVGALLGQGTNKHLPGRSSSRVLLVAWLVFTFVVGTVYRGNLTAALTMPKYPHTPETLEQLVKVVHK
ncbi:uncharacterized protein [Procambarus clarkii]|uniref:uncharacterized protein n=1 Tax=Procambarus clarkii TaxID=6728 RepID=UPI003743B0B4